MSVARALYPDQVSFAERYAPLTVPGMQLVASNGMVMPLPSFALTFMVLFGMEAYVRLLYQVAPDARSLPRNAQMYLDSLPMREVRTLLPKEEVLFLLQCASAGALDSLLVPHLLEKMRRRETKKG